MRLPNVQGWGLDPQNKTLKVEMDYLGKELSVNHYKMKDGRKRWEVKRWMDQLAWVVSYESRAGNWGLIAPVRVRIGGQFKDKRSTPDLHNLAKVVLDSIAKGLGIDDRHIELETGQPGIGESKIIIEILGG